MEADEPPGRFLGGRQIGGDPLLELAVRPVDGGIGVENRPVSVAIIRTEKLAMRGKALPAASVNAFRFSSGPSRGAVIGPPSLPIGPFSGWSQ